MSDNSIVLVNYFKGQFLRTQDFKDEQAYHLGMRYRHNIGHHSWGIVYGLELVNEEGQILVKRGVGVDGLGRYLVLTENQLLASSSAIFQSKGSDVLEVWLVYKRIGSDRAPKGYTGCGEDASNLFYRWQERPIIRLTAPDLAFPNKRRPEGVAQVDLEPDPTRTHSPDDQRYFPLYLGRIEFDAENTASPFRVDLSDRPYAGLVGEFIKAPSGRACVQVGAELEADRRRFAVFVPETRTNQNTPLEPSLEISDTGDLSLAGSVTVNKDVIVDGGALEIRAGTVRPLTASPWRIYHLEDPAIGEHELRIEMAPPVTGGTPGLNQVSIGSWSAEQKTFSPCLTVQDNCNVIVHGNLVVRGQITQGGGTVSSWFSPSARSFLLNTLISGISGAGGLLSTVYRSPFSTPPVGQNVILTPEAITRLVARAIATDPTQRSAFLNMLEQENADFASRWREASEG